MKRSHLKLKTAVGCVIVLAAILVAITRFHWSVL